ncbi:hypothetical protein NEDG_00903 [Nematocida displodere]|uniref:Uncharacterized protein n=1 Tax=Nematocida displodere TaxID=1805483 RepID=A0A177EEC8_9MICR|nr:hypothetical protein NEDG_00903 [Nematocida displodere]
MSKKAENEKVGIYQEFMEGVRKAEFVRLLCLSREIEQFSALFVVVSILEKELIKYEVLWGAEEKKDGPDVFEILFGEGHTVARGAVFARTQAKTPQVLFLCEGTLSEVLFTLCKTTGNLTQTCLWSICVGMYASIARPELAVWKEFVRECRNEHESGNNENDENDENEPENEHRQAEQMPPLHTDIKMEIERLGGQVAEKKKLEIKRCIYFPFGQWLTFYEALSSDACAIEELGLFFQRKNRNSPGQTGGEYLLNQFLARLGISIASAQSATIHNLVGAVQKIVQGAFSPRSAYFHHYDFNVPVSHVEGFFSISGLIRKKRYVEALFAFKEARYLNVSLGLQEYRRVVQMTKLGMYGRKVLRVGGYGVVLIPRGVIEFKSENEVSLMKEVFVNVFKLSVSRSPDKDVIMVVYVADLQRHRIIYKDHERIRWVDTTEQNIIAAVKEIAGRVKD